MYRALKIGRYFPHYLRKRFKKKYIVIESDDWGLELAIEASGLSYLAEQYGRSNFSRWSTDALETSEDLTRLYAVLDKYHGKFLKGPIITANFITHNVDYEVTDRLTFRPISEGFNTGSEDVRDLYKEGMRRGLIFPQLHGYSHYNLSILSEFFATVEGREAFMAKFLAGKSTIKGNLSIFRGELSTANESAADQVKQSQAVFEALFGYKSKTIIPPAFVIDGELIAALRVAGVNGLQGSNRLINSTGKPYQKIYFRKSQGLIWIPRNARLDPHMDYRYYADKCLMNIQDCFSHQMPVVIDFHRVNFSGKYNPAYRDQTLSELDYLLSMIHKMWPEVEFVTSQEILEICLQ